MKYIHFICALTIFITPISFADSAQQSTKHDTVQTSEKTSTHSTQQQKLREDYEEKHRHLEPKVTPHEATSAGHIQDFPIRTDDAPAMNSDATTANQ